MVLCDDWSGATGAGVSGLVGGERVTGDDAGASFLWDPFEILWSKAVLHITKMDGSSRKTVYQAVPEQIKKETF